MSNFLTVLILLKTFKTMIHFEKDYYFTLYFITLTL